MMRKMTRKIRHPHQVMEAREMAVGARYAFVHASKSSKSGTVSAISYVMGGVFRDSIGEALALGFDLNMDPQVDKLFPSAPDENIVTIHMDGWWYHSATSGNLAEPTMVYWVHNRLGYDHLSTYLELNEDEDDDEEHYIVVPSQHWIDDPRLHVTDWSNPDTVIERAASNESPVEFDRRMRAKLDAAMAKALGF